MAKYRFAGAEGDDRFETIYATNPALLGTSIVYVESGSTTHRSPVILWGVLADGSAVPITMSGVWDDTTELNRFVLFPDGSCADEHDSWKTLDDAVLARS